jgi:general secretion pathway protein G
MKRKTRRFLLAAGIFLTASVVILLLINRYVMPRIRETALKEDLHSMRKQIDQYAADKQQLPGSLDDLVEAGYLSEIPMDAITRRRDWNIEIGQAIIAQTQTEGVIDVHSRAPGTGSNGIPFTEY